ncbi:hydrogenase 4 subunit F [Desulforamulus ruminis]|uniref:hydrogenase 4 subunit F n=1 Tax=Desulforamulus ruminis TaxID=1564 RepID=UPI002FDB32B5
MLYLLLSIPFFTGVLCWLSLPLKWLERINVLGAALTGALAFYAALGVFREQSLAHAGSLLVIDELSAVLVFIIGMVGTLCCLYSVQYLWTDLKNGELTENKIGRFFGLLHFFIATMYLSVLADNLGLMWVAIEGTTIVSALLVAFYGHKAALEAAWKYIIICTVGIAFAMLGIILTFYAAREILGSGDISLSWRSLYPVAASLDPSVMKLAFIFVLVGYGTKAGLFPLHTWLPDAHSQAPSPVSALLSGVLLNCAIYAIVRFHLLTSLSAGSGFSGHLLMIFGLISMAAAVPFILVQKDIKRLLAYSSVEHVGIIVLGLGLGGVLGYTGAILHLINHALAKSALFLTAGTLTQKYNSKLIARIQGIGQLLPITGTLFMASLLAIGGAPPFGLFFSELTVATRGFHSAGVLLGFLFLMVIAIVFAGLVYFGGKMYFSDTPSRFFKGESLTASHLLILLPIGLLIFQGIYMPQTVQELIDQVVQFITVGGGVANV